MDMSKLKFMLAGAVVSALGIVLGTVLWLKLGPHPVSSRGFLEGGDGTVQYGSVPAFSLTERSGSTVSLTQLHGKIWVADFIYTHCADTCPLQTAMMAQLQEKYAGQPEFRLVSFSVDPERDTPQALALYADKYRADSDRWLFLTGERNRIIHLVQDGFHLAVATIPNNTDPSGAIPHSSRFVLVDKQGRIRGYYDSREPESFARHKNDIDALMKG